MKIFLAMLIALAVLALSGCGDAKGGTANSGAGGATLRLGYFANITHAQALIGVSNGAFQKALGETKLETKIFNAGPSVVEALFAGEIDISYIGPTPALNAYIKSNGSRVRVISGASANGVVIVASKASGITKLDELKGKRVATPQFGNTQDVSARHYLLNVLKARFKENGGETDIQPVANADQLNLFKQGQLDVSWAPEPWGARLVHEAGATIIAEEKDLWEAKRFTSALVIVSTDFLKKHPAAVEAFLRAHHATTAWIKANPDEAATTVNNQLQALVGKSLKPEVLKDAFARVEFTTDPLEESVKTFAAWSKELGLIKSLPDLGPFFDLALQKKILVEAAPK